MTQSDDIGRALEITAQAYRDFGEANPGWAQAMLEMYVARNTHVPLANPLTMKCSLWDMYKGNPSRLEPANSENR